MEHGWYDKFKNLEEGEVEQAEVGEKMKAKLRRTGGQVENHRENISLGSLSLSQFEDMKRRSEELLNSQKEQVVEFGKRKKVEADLETVLMKLERFEEEKTSQEA